MAANGQAINNLWRYRDVASWMSPAANREPSAAVRTRAHRRAGLTVRGAAAFVLACVPLQLFADSKSGEAKAQLCILCHKEALDKRFVPLLEAQPPEYLVAAITAFKTGKRKTSEPAMTTNLKPLSEADIRDIAEFFAGKPLAADARGLEAASIAVGEKLVTQMQCGSCHKPTFLGGGTTPRLAGQKPAYLIYQLEAFRDGRRSHPPDMPTLRERADMENVASYLASLR